MYTFIGHESWRNPFEPAFLEYINSNKKVTVVRGAMFFYTGEITTLGRITAHFTDLAIEKLVNDGFIIIHD